MTQAKMQWMNWQNHGMFSSGLTSRPDVAKAYPQYSNAAQSGFAYTLPEGTIPSGEHSIDVAFIPNSGAAFWKSVHVTIAAPADNKTGFPGTQYFRIGATSNYALIAGKALVQAGCGSHYNVGPSTTWGEADKANMPDFQRRVCGFNADTCDGIPGSLTWAHLQKYM
jgi:hypothetical protein